MADPNNKTTVLEELKRLRAKFSAIEDRDIKQALQLRIEALDAQVEKFNADEAAQRAAEDAAIGQEAEPLAEATPEQLRKADELIRQARVEKMRKNNARVLALMKEAAAVAPTAPSVLEVLGDDYTERRQYKDALKAYTQAVKFSKNNVELERKHATATLRAGGMSSLDGTDSLFLTSQDSLASVGGARILNAFVPGMGHLVVGKTIAGISLMTAMVVFAIWLAVMQKDVASLVSMVKGRSAQPNLLVLVPLFGLVVTYIVGLTSLGGQPTLKQNRNAPRPRPPMDLPFE